MNNLLMRLLSRPVTLTTRLLCSKKPPRSQTDAPTELSPRPEAEFYNSYSQPDKGVIFDKKPVKVAFRKDYVYHWCACGFSHKQPFCDGTHKNRDLNKKKMSPVKIVATKDEEVWLCNCKQTKKRPFCDGTHKSKEVQEAKATMPTQ